MKKVKGTLKILPMSHKCFQPPDLSTAPLAVLPSFSVILSVFLCVKILNFPFQCVFLSDGQVKVVTIKKLKRDVFLLVCCFLNLPSGSFITRLVGKAEVEYIGGVSV